MNPIAIKVENLSKSYRLGLIGGKTLREDLNRWWARARRKPDPTLKIGQADHGNIMGETIWALRDVSFEIQQGEVLGIIGRNGAGKSTLLKIISRITAPTAGQIKVKGRIGSLLEVGTGFHPELTGRENIYLNGVILGMKRAEIDSKFDEIVDFSGVEKFIDTPVKRYSSGMYVRLAFAVAAHLDPEILVVDEVLAVGDFEFQKKCLGKMGEVAKEGRTVLFVSHNMGAVQSLCSSGLVLKSGKLVFEGNSSDAVNFYLVERELLVGGEALNVKSQTMTLKTIEFLQNGEVREWIQEGVPAELVLNLKSSKQHPNATINISIKDNMDTTMSLLSNRCCKTTLDIEIGENRFKCILNDIPFVSGMYYVSAKIIGKEQEILWAPDCFVLKMIDSERGGAANYYKQWQGRVLLTQNWSKC